MRGLIAASLAALSMSGAYADELAPVPSAAEEHSQGTLDKLAGQDIPNTDPVQTYPESGSAYTLTKVQEGGEKPDGDNIITKFTYNAETKVMTPVYYKLDLKQTTYGEGDTSQTFTLTSEPVKGVEITAKYNTPTAGTYANEYRNQTLNLEERNPTSSSSSHYKVIGGAVKDADFSDSVLFENNKINAVLNVNGGGSSWTYKYIDVLGGALYNSSTIDNITGLFKDNSIKGTINETNNKDRGSIYAYGGAIYNNGDIKNINADFVGNNISISDEDGYMYGYGGAIANFGTIDNIVGDFVDNSVSSNSASNGGAVYNDGDINNITGAFIENSASIGGAVYNDGDIENITGDFIDNTASSGGAIYNGETMTSVTGNFIANSASNGGVIYNWGTISFVTGDFIGNTVTSDGGAIYNDGTMSSVIADFIGNSASSNYYSGSYGGAIYNGYRSTIGDITGDFIGNTATSGGGAIYNSGTMTSVTGDFIGNNVSSNYSNNGYGGAIYNSEYSTMTYITGDFIGNTSSTSGGAIYNNEGTIENLTGNFMDNSSGSGGAIHNRAGTINQITGSYIHNSASGSYGYGGAIYNSSYTHDDSSYSTRIDSIKGDFIENSADYGGAISNISAWNDYYGPLELVPAEISNISGDFIKNKGTVAGGAIYNRDGIIDKISGDFVENYVDSEEDNSVYGGAIYNTGTIGEIEGSFVENYATSETGEAKGGAIYSTSDIKIVAKDGYQSVFSGNYTESNGVKDDNAIYMDNSDTTLSFEMSNGGSVYMADNIDGASGYNVNITGDDKEQTTFYMLNDIRNADVTVGNTTLNTINNQSHTYDFNSFTLSGDTNMVADVDLANETMDRFTAESYGEHQGTLNVNGMNLLSDAPDNRPVTEIYFAQIGLKDHVTNGTGELPDGTQTTAYTPIYKYHVMYDNRDDGGYFMFTKGDRIFNETPGGGIGGGGITTTPTGNPSDAFNPAVLSSPVSAQAGAYASMNEAMQYAFEHADAFTQLPLMDRIAKINENKYALSTDYNNNLGSLAPEFNNKAGWVRPYVTFENMHLKNGPRVDAVTYGTLVGFDSDFQKLKNGWTGLTTGYIGYNGSQLNYSGVDTTMNGGVLGITETFYKKNFWTALTIGAGASVGQSNTMYGKEDFTSLMAGVASKTGYNFEFKEGRFIIQPIWQMSYTFVNTFDYTNAAGVRIDSDPMHTIQLNPSVRFIANLQNGWQPYASVGMVWNLLNDTNVRANGVSLPDMSVKPYVEYGVGVQKRFKDKFTGFLQAMLRNGGRNGIALTGGLRWSIGKDGAPIEKVQNIEKPKTVIKLSSMGLNPSTSDVVSGSDKGILNQVQNDRNAANEEILKRVQDDRTVRNDKTATAGGKKIIKQLSPAQKTALGAKPQNTTRTTTVGVLKQL